jgi:hypothetical protein
MGGLNIYPKKAVRFRAAFFYFIRYMVMVRDESPPPCFSLYFFHTAPYEVRTE